MVKKPLALAAMGIVTLPLLGTACGGGGDTPQDLTKQSIESYRVAAIDRNIRDLNAFFNPNYREECQPAVLTVLLAFIDPDVSVDINQVASVTEGGTQRVTVNATGPWGDDGVFVARVRDGVADETGRRVAEFLADPLLFECLKAGSSQALDKWNALSPRILEVSHQLEILGVAEEEEIAGLIEYADPIVQEFTGRLDELSQGDDYVGRLELLAQGSALLSRLEEVEIGLPGIESIVPSTLEECRDDFHPYKVCAELGLAPPLAYAGPYSFSGSAMTRTDDFCLTADKMTIEYSAQGIGRFPDIYHVTIWLYDDQGNFVDAVVGLEGSGAVTLSTNGEGCYYLDVDPYDASWTVSVKQ